MNMGSEPTRNSGLQTAQSSSMTSPEGKPQPVWMEVYPSDDSTDYVEFGAMLWRRRRLLAWVFGVLMALFILLAIFKKPSYDYTTSIQLGAMVAQDGTMVPLMSPQTAAGLLQSKYIPDAMYQYEAQQQVDLRTLKIAADADSEST
ncbi:MAG TPA: hypothetical protein VFK12_09105, partial [Gammaproteobacteria bacterium]|nr:hypothetical protein [Gammaproteobacteria bacterium]